MAPPSNEAIKTTVLRILESHGVRSQFEHLLSSKLPDAPKSKDGPASLSPIWSIEIIPKEGICTFSKPLIIATEASHECRVVRLAHSWADVWDVTYDPLYEYVIAPAGDWVPVNVYSTNQGGFKIFESTKDVEEAIEFSHAWANTLEERGYADVRQAQTPFYLFAKLMECIPADDIRHHFKVYPRSFRGETAIAAMVDSLGFARSEAEECMGGVLYAQLIINADKPREQELKPRHIYCVSVKGALVLRDVKAKRLLAESPQTVYSNPRFSASTNILYVDRDMDGNLALPEATLNVLFRYALGDRQPNLTRFENPATIFCEGMPETAEAEGSGSNGLTTIWPLFLRDRVVRLKGYTHAFTGTGLVDWVLRCSSVVSRVEAMAVASAFVDAGWIVNVNSEDASSPAPSPTLPGTAFTGVIQIRDTTKSVYQPSLTGVKLLGWDLTMDTPSVTSAVQGFFRAKKTGEPEERPSSRASITNGTPGGRESILNDDRGDGQSRKSDADSGKPPGSKSMTHLDVDSAADGDFHGWESCHTNLISMDGTKAASRSKTTSIAPTSPHTANGSMSAGTSIGQVTIDELSANKIISKIISAARPKAVAIKKAAAAQYSQANLPEMLPMDPSIPRDPLVVQLKEKTHTLRLVQILETQLLCEQFRKYNHFMYSQENFGFWSEADAFRRLYSSENAVIVPGQPILYKEDAAEVSKPVPPFPQLVAHAMAIYLKYIVDEAPYEVNVGSLRKKTITAAVTCEELLPFFELVNPECIVSDALIDPATVLLPGTEAMLTGRLAGSDGTVSKTMTASLLDVAENHIFALMATDSVPKFLKTTAYHDTMLECIKSGALKRFDDDEGKAEIAPDLAKFAADKRHSSLFQPAKQTELDA
ncbi:hypothetical protein HDU80_008457 [Chytriomyces hyalinus]|nr:hypothetical protein HDU80_008457 [Chytriomyces hyalinus]